MPYLKTDKERIKAISEEIRYLRRARAQQCRFGLNTKLVDAALRTERRKHWWITSQYHFCGQRDQRAVHLQLELVAKDLPHLISKEEFSLQSKIERVSTKEYRIPFRIFW